MTSPCRRWLAGALLVGLGAVLSPGAVPVYDGVGQPDEPYRYVAAPEGAKTTAAPTGAHATTPVQGGRSTNGLSVATEEKGPQFSLFLPPQAMAAAKGPVDVDVTPSAPTDAPAGGVVDGNVYTVTLTSAGGPVTLTERAAIATVYLRATTAKQPAPSLYRRESPTSPWTALATSRGGTDFYVAAFPGPGQFAVVFGPGGADEAGGGPPVLLLVLLGGLVLLVAVVLVVRRRATSE